jgi:hypothetical protein
MNLTPKLTRVTTIPVCRFRDPDHELIVVGCCGSSLEEENGRKKRKIVARVLYFLACHMELHTQRHGSFVLSSTCVAAASQNSRNREKTRRRRRRRRSRDEEVKEKRRR